VIDWQAIVRQHGQVVWQTAFRLLDSEADAADCFQETFISALAVSQRQRIKNWRALLRHLATARALDRLPERVQRQMADMFTLTIHDGLGGLKGIGFGLGVAKFSQV